MNMFMLVGRVYREFELKNTKNGKSVVELPLAVNNGKDDTTFISVQLFGNIAETTSKYINKGDIVGVKGNIKNNNWEDKDGNKHYDYQFIVDKISFLSTKKKEDEKKDENIDTPKNVKSEYDSLGSDVKLEDSDLPF